MVDRSPLHRIPLAIVGMACRLPGADNLEQYWRMLIEGRSAVVELPPDRLDQALYFDSEVGARGKTYSKLGAIVSNRDFHHDRCPIPEQLTHGVDLCHLLMCETAADALRDARLDPFHLPQAYRNAAVFIGHAQGSSLGPNQVYAASMDAAAEFLRESPQFKKLPPAEQQAVMHELVQHVRSQLREQTAGKADVASSLIAGAINKAFGLSGPYLAINSACASSLQAILLGARALQTGRVNMAIVGGASDLKGDTLILFANARAMSKSGTRPFDADADGLVVGEGYGALVMKTLERAVADGDHIWAVLRGAGVSSDGKGKSLWAPRKEGQVKAMERAYRGGLEIADIEYIEAHATATQLGDATELNTLTEIFSEHFPKGKRIPITSVKANIGHALETAGVAGVIKTALAMHHGMIPPGINITDLNPKIDWEHAPVYVPRTPVPWPKRPDGKPRRAGVNAFGIGGLNMHVVLDEFNEKSRALVAPSPSATGGSAAGSPAESSDERAIAIIGLGCILPGAHNPSEFWQLLTSGRDPKIPVPADRWRTELIRQSSDSAIPADASLVGGFVTGFEYDWKRHKLPPKQVAQADPLQFMLLEAADQAMKDAGYDERPFARENVGVLVGTEFGGDFGCELQVGLRLPELQQNIEQLLSGRGFDAAASKSVTHDYAEALLKRWPALIDETGSFSTSSLASRIGKTWNMMGGAATIDAGETSGLAALAVSVDMLLAGDCDMMLCAAGQRRMASAYYESLAVNGKLPHGDPRSPLDAKANGVAPAEGVVVLLLKRLADARRDGDRVHAILRSVGAAHGASPADALESAARRSFETRSAQPTEIAAVELDTFDGPQATAEEVGALAAVYGQGSRRQPLHISSVMGQIGNAQGAASLVSLLKAVLEVEHGELPANSGIERPASFLGGWPNVMDVPATAVAIPAADGRRLAAVASCSRNLAFHAIVEKPVPVAQPASAPVRTPGLAAAPAAAHVAGNGAKSHAAATTAIDVAELEKFLINFVVEQTGYPPEVVELDANLEADLGIDSIKKAQMFGELQEYFEVTPTDNLTLDDFPTLRHIVAFLASAPQKATAPKTAALVPAAPMAAAAAPTRAAAPAGASAQRAATTVPSARPVGASVPPAKSPAIKRNEPMRSTPPSGHNGSPSSKPSSAPTNGPVKSAVAASATQTPTAAGVRQPSAKTSTQPPAESNAAAPSICRFGASDPAGLRRMIEAALADAHVWDSSRVRRFTAQDSFRLAVVADSPATLSTRLTTALKQLENPAAQTVLEQQGIFYRKADPRTRIAFLFPGQGSQYVGMLRQLATELPAVEAERHGVNAVMTRLGGPSWEQLAWDESSPLGKDVFATQLSILLADALVLAALRERGIVPDLAAGHSYGEYAALYAAAAWDLEQAVRVTRWRCESIEACPSTDGAMLATTATPDTIEQLAAGIDGPIYVANHNAPDQTVVGGTAVALGELEQILQQSLFETRLLPVPRPFHTPLMRDAAELFGQRLAKETFNPPQFPVYSVATNEVVRHPDEIRSNLIAHLTTPVRYADLIRKLASEAPTVFVEVGPQQALTRLNRRILGATDFVGVACDNPARPGAEQLLRVQALLEASGALDRVREKPRAVPAPARQERDHAGQKWQFDATERRRAKMRQTAAGNHEVAAKAASPVSPPAKPALTKTEPSKPAASAPAPRAAVFTPPARQAFGSQSRIATTASAPAAAPLRPTPPTWVAPAESPVAKPAPVRPAATPAPAANAPQAVAKPQPATAALNGAELEKFLINFVVEQTGYPPEVVELDANLEADLGIDSIKKAQMFGELQEYFEVTPTDNLTLDDFPTLRHIVNFLAQAPQKGTAPETTAAESETDAVLSQPAQRASAPATTVAAPAMATAAPSKSGGPASLDVAELEKFLINFVVEQTGYPPEVVELDANLEADLGIDSIKKAQMFGELQEYFEVTPTDNLTLDDFPTLRHIVNFLAQSPQKAVAAAPATVQPVAETPVSQPPQRTPAPPMAAAAPSKPAGGPASLDVAELEKFLINFVVEQTGYPPEVVELDANLEADLGIDSIKKAQMFGELQEYFEVAPTDNLTLDDFPTLRHIVNFLAGVPQKGAATAAAEPATVEPAAEAEPESFASESEPAAQEESEALESATVGGFVAAVPSASTAQIDVLHLRGTPYAMGRQHGLEKKTAIRIALKRIADLTSGDWGELPIPPEARSNPERFFTAVELEELRGIAEAVEVPVGNLVALNLAVLNDLASNCAHLATASTGQEKLHGLVADLSLPAALTEVLTPVVEIREPDEGWATATVTLAGIVGSLLGLNGNGLAASSAAILNGWPESNGNGNGAGSALRVEEVLRRMGAIHSALDELREDAPSHGWNLCLSQRRERRLFLGEHDGRTVAAADSDTRLAVTNHCVLRTTNAPAPPSSVERLDWLTQRLDLPQSPRNAGELLQVLGDLPGRGMLRLAAVVDNERGDLLLSCGGIRERIPVKALLPEARKGEPGTNGRKERVTAAPGLRQPSPHRSAPVAEGPSSEDLVEDPDAESTRYVMRLFPAPWATPPADFPAWKGAAVVEGQNPIADALIRRLQAGGAHVFHLPTSDSAEQAIARVEQLWGQSGPGGFVYLFLTSHRDDASFDRTKPAEWDRIVERRALVPFTVCQRWLQLAGDADRLNDCMLVSVTDLGGDLGFSGRVVTPESGFLSGLSKTLLAEYVGMHRKKDFRSKVIDAPRTENPERLAANICREVAAAAIDYELAFINDQRHLQVAVPASAELQPGSKIRPGSTWVLSGGARGITAQCGLALGRRFGLKLHLLGTQALEPIDPTWRDLDEAGQAELRKRIATEALRAHKKPHEVWAKVQRQMEMDRNLHAFTEAGIAFTYHACDVSDRAALAEVLARIRAADGPIEGIVHGAGFEQSGRFDKKTPETLRATVRSKVSGAYHLMLLTRDDPVSHFIAFGSIAGRLGSSGQTDYSAASDLLCKLMGWYRMQRPQCHAIGFHWHGWRETGMASRPESQVLLKAQDVRLMSTRVGLRHLLRELYARTAETEVLITDRRHHARYYGNDVDAIVARGELVGDPRSAPIAAAASEAGTVPTFAGPALAPKADSVEDESPGWLAARFQLRMVDAPLNANENRLPLPRAAFLLGDNPDADALAQNLRNRGVEVTRLPVDDDAKLAREALERAWSESPVNCLIVMTSRDPEAARLDDRDGAVQRIRRGVYVPYWVMQKWVQLLEKRQPEEPATLVAVTSLGGDFGFMNPVIAPEGGALAGFLKSIFIEDARTEHSRFRLKVVDLPGEEPPAHVADSICRELAADRPEIEVAWSHGRRQVVATPRQPARSLRLSGLRRGATWVVTGGARGITAAAALELGRRYGLKMHLVGKSAAPDPNAPWRHYNDEQLKSLKMSIVRQATAEGRSPNDDWERVRTGRMILETLDDFAAAGVHAVYHACDVANWDEMERMLAEVRAQNGPIEGIIHGAGYARPFRFGGAQPKHMHKTLSPKLDGTLALMNLTRNDPLRYFVALGSISGRFGGNGLSDYAAANDMLAKLCGWFRHHRPDCRTTCFHFQSWDEIGMAMLADGLDINKSTLKMNFIPPDEGISHFVNELEAQAPESEVLITDQYFQRVFYPYDFEISSSPQAAAPSSPRVTPTPSPRSAPLVSEWQPAAGGGLAKIVFDPINDPFLTQHLFKRRPFLPGVMGVESVLQAARCATNGREIREVRQLRIVNGLLFHDDNPIGARVTVTPCPDGLSCQLLTELRDRKGRLIKSDRLHVEAVVPISESAEPFAASPLEAPTVAWSPFHYLDASEVLICHGDVLRCLKEYAFHEDSGWGKIVASPLSELAGARSSDGWITSPAVLDACVVTCGSYLMLRFGPLEVPYGFDRLRWLRLPEPGETCVVSIVLRDRGPRHSIFDFILYGHDEQPLLRADGYHTIRVGA